MNKPLRNGQISENYRECKNCNTWKDHTERCMQGKTGFIYPDMEGKKFQVKKRHGK